MIKTALDVPVALALSATALLLRLSSRKHTLRRHGALRRGIHPRRWFFRGRGGQEMLPGPFAKAAALMESLIQHRPFVDGNERTGTASTDYSLRRHGYRLVGVTNAQLVELSLAVAAHRMGTGDLSQWFEERAEAL